MYLFPSAYECVGWQEFGSFLSSPIARERLNSSWAGRAELGPQSIAICPWLRNVESETARQPHLFLRNTPENPITPWWVEICSVYSIYLSDNDVKASLSCGPNSKMGHQVFKSRKSEEKVELVLLLSVHLNFKSLLNCKKSNLWTLT